MDIEQARTLKVGDRVGMNKPRISKIPGGWLCSLRVGFSFMVGFGSTPAEAYKDFTSRRHGRY